MLYIWRGGRLASLPEVARLYKLSERFHIQYKITLRVREGDFLVGRDKKWSLSVCLGVAKSIY